MKAMILAAGRGERMHPLSKDTAKSMLLVNNKPLIEHHVIALARAGIKDIVINLFHLGEQIQNYLGNGDKYNVNIHYSQENSLLNTGGGISNALQYLGDDPFITVSADIYTSFPFSSILNKDITNSAAHVILVKNPDFHQKGDFAFDGDKVKRKNDYENSSYTYGNIGIFSTKLFKNINEKVFPLSKILFSAIDKNLLTGELYHGKWFNVGTPQQLKQINSKF